MPGSTRDTENILDVEPAHRQVQGECRLLSRMRDASQPAQTHEHERKDSGQHKAAAARVQQDMGEGKGSEGEP